MILVRIAGDTALFSAQESLEKLETLDVKMVYPGHGKPFTDYKRAISMSKKRIEGYLDNREKIGTELIKKIILFTLMANKTFPEETFYSYLTNTYGYRETVDLYFNADYKAIYKEIIDGFFKRGLLKRRNGNLYTIVKR